MKIKALLFDMDGTIFDVPYDWRKIRSELGTSGIPILTYLSGLQEPEKSAKWKILEKYEAEATQAATLRKGMSEWLDDLTKRGLKIALVTNNSQENVSFLLNKFRLEFDCIISRESGFWKPSGAPFIEVMNRLSLKREECAVVGDSHFDVQAALEAGIEHIFLLNEDEKTFAVAGVEVFLTIDELKTRIAELLE